MRERAEQARARGQEPTWELPDDYPGVNDGVERPWMTEEFLAAVNREPTPEELRKIEAKEEEVSRLRDADELVIDAREYGLAASRIAIALEQELAARGDPLVMAAIDAIGRHALCISVKTWRAVGGRLQALLDEDDVDDEDDLQSDANGSAKLARLLVAESRENWSVLMQVGHADGLPVRMAAWLDRLDAGLAHRFPRAMDFVRPGFDE
jgi:hypothetical protein